MTKKPQRPKKPKKPSKVDHARKWFALRLNGVRSIDRAYRRGLHAGWELVVLPIRAGGDFTGVRVFKKATQIHWLVGGMVAAGSLVRNLTKSRWQVTFVLVAEKHRRRGIYSGVLDALRVHLGEPVWSDEHLSPEALALWNKIAAGRDGKHLHNPKTKR